MTNKQQNKMTAYYSQFKRSDRASIWDAYDNQSARKINSFLYLKALALNEDIKILGFNCMKYTTGMIQKDESTGELFFRVDTAQNTYICPLSMVEC